MISSTAFIVRLWSEQGNGEMRDRVWRGVVIHVPTGERTLIRSLHEVAQVMAMYLQEEEPDNAGADA